MSNVHIKFNEDIDNYEPSDSENEYTEKEKALLTKSRKRKDNSSDSEEEVFGLNADSDIEDNLKDDLPDVRAWGHNKRNFYSTDYVDQDYGGFREKEEQDAVFEEDEAKNIQKRLAEQLEDADFSLHLFNDQSSAKTSENIISEEIIKSDLSALSKRELIQILEKESPELFVLIKDCEEKLIEMKSFLAPIIKQNINECKALDFVKTFYHLTLNYCTNIYMYFYLKVSKINVKTHPVLKRLYQYRQLLAQLEPIYNEIIKPQIEILLESNKETAKKVKKLKLLQKLDENTKRKSDEIIDEKKKTVRFQDEENESNDLIETSDEEMIPSQDNIDLESEKRAITYQIAKNKGLTPHRKKEQRNPRVKHRNKYKKAKIRRKGAVREVRTELTRYGGEISGIKATVSKSIKLK